MMSRLSSVWCFLFVILGLNLRGSVTRAGDDIDPTMWKGAGAAAFMFAMGVDALTNKVVQLTTIQFLNANTNLTLNHCTDSTNAYAHVHFWDTDANNGNGDNDFSTANQTLAQRFWDFAFGVSQFTGSGKLDGDKVTSVSLASFNQECGAYAFTYCGCKGTYAYGFSNGTLADAARQVITKAGDRANVNVKDMLAYSNGTANLGYHFTAVQTVNNKLPQILRWKFQWSGVYTLERTSNFLDNPMYWAGAKPGAVVGDWKFFKRGAGDEDLMDVFSVK
jgi:hypothetical protein